ncbi:protein Mis18-alpha [Platichthys flesus]|uniref:protein Mis18-alpha n=1 Tax=Platichthys flesus TaxID=8260 RepID=UPI001A7F4F79|nr:protein Mis18-alpha [Platichthys flesus]XP_062262778.1 protein Mis18-alpha [Platichthys flesus]XP_062262779.1 protein Mis18-alpha [Platichthys flesus]
MAEREKVSQSKHRQKKVNNYTFQSTGADSTCASPKTCPRNGNSTFETSSINSSVVEEKLFGRQEEEAAEDGPVLFICGKCKSPVGDSLSWDGSEDGQNQIRLKRVTDNVLVGNDSRLHEAGKDSLCLIMDLFCRACHSVLGMVYTSTPKKLDHKRFAFCFNVADIDSYVLGSASQMLAAEGPKEQLVTLEYRAVVEQQLTEMKMLVMSMSQRLEEIEAGVQDGYDGV